MIYEAQSRETISDSLQIGCVSASLGQISMKEHLLMSATKCDSWTNFVRKIESIEHARKTITAPTPMDLDAFQGNCHKCGKYGHTAKDCRSSNHGGTEKPQRPQHKKKHHQQCWTRSYTSSHQDSQKGGWKGDKKNGKGTRKVESTKVEKAENMGKEKVKERKDNVSTKSQNHQRNSGQVDLGNNGLNNLGAQKPTLRVGVTMIGTLQIRILRLQQPKNFNMRLSGICECRIWVMSNTSNLFNMTDFILHSELSHLVLTPQHAKLLFLPITLQHVDFWSTKIHYLDVRIALQAETKCMVKERGSCAPQMRQESQWPSREEKSAVDDL